MVNHMRGRICPNPRCGREIGKPILLYNLSATPAEQYYACPRCFTKLSLRDVRVILAGLFLTACGLVILTWVAWLIWYDVTMWGKDIVLILLQSRTGEGYSLGVGARIIHYLLIGLTPLILGVCTALLGRRGAIRGLPNATARKAKDARAVEVTLKLPKTLVDFLKTKEESTGMTVEEYLQGSVFRRVAMDSYATKGFLSPDMRGRLPEDSISRKSVSTNERLNR